MQWDGLGLCGKHSMSACCAFIQRRSYFHLMRPKKTPNLWALANRLASDLHSASHSSKALETQACRNPCSFKKYNWRWRGFCLKHKWLNKWWKSMNKKNSKKSWKKGIFSYLFTKNACFLFSGAASTTGSRPQWDTFDVWHSAFQHRYMLKNKLYISYTKKNSS